MKRMSFGTWVINKLKLVPSKTKQFLKDYMDSLKEPESWGRICLVAGIFGIIPVLMSSIFLFPYGLISLPLWWSFIIYTYYRSENPQEACNR